MAQGIFPVKDSEFNTYFGNVAPYLTTHATRLGVSTENITALGELKDDWDIKFPQSQNPDLATKTIIDEKIEIREDTEELLRAIYDDIPKSALTTADRNTLNLKERQPGSSRPPITTSPNVSVRSTDNLTVLIECRVEHDSTRPSIHPDADGVEIVGSIGNTAPASYDDTVKLGISKKARIKHIHDQPADAGKNFYVFARWINLSDPTKNGPWSNIASGRLL